jgi:hypothetical protein
MPPFGSRTLHAKPWSLGWHAVLHAEPDGPLPIVVAAVTQQTCPPVQSLCLVQATHTGLAHSIRSA